MLSPNSTSSKTAPLASMPVFCSASYGALSVDARALDGDPVGLVRGNPQRHRLAVTLESAELRQFHARLTRLIHRNRKAVIFARCTSNPTTRL